MEGEQSGVPAGWYPDPLGLPRLRWWDGAVWSEFTSEEAAPAKSEPEPVAGPVDDGSAAFADSLADFLNGNISQGGATGVNPVVPQASEPMPFTTPVPEVPAVAPIPIGFVPDPNAGAVPIPGFASGPVSTPAVPMTTMQAPQIIGYDDDGREFIEPIVPIVTTPGAAPVPPGGAPVAPGGAPVPLGGAPVAPGGAPVAPGGAPVPLGGAPVPLGGAPVPPGGAPVAPGGAPVPLGGAPLAPGGAPVVPRLPAEVIPQPASPVDSISQPADSFDSISQPLRPATAPVPPQPVPSQPAFVAPQTDPVALADNVVYADADAEVAGTFGSRRARREHQRLQEVDGVPVISATEPPYAGATTAPVVLWRDESVAATDVAPMPPVPAGGPVAGVIPVPAGGPVVGVIPVPSGGPTTDVVPVPPVPSGGLVAGVIPVPAMPAGAPVPPVPAGGPVAPIPVAAPVPPRFGVPAAPIPGVPVPPVPGVPVSTTPANVGRPDGFVPESSAVSDDYPPERRPVDKQTYSGASYLLAFLGIFPAALIALLVVAFGFGDDQRLVWAVWAAAWLAGILLAFYDRLKLKSWGHQNTANPLLAIFTPILYLVARSTATKGETGHGQRVLVYWIIGLLVMAAIVYLVPQVMEATIPGFDATWSSPLGA